MSSKKFFLFALCTICLITFASKVYSQEKNEKIISEKEAGQLILLFSPTEEIRETIESMPEFLAKREGKKLIQVNLRSFVNAFEGFKIEQIEVWVSMVVETEGFTKLFISSKGEGGIKLLLKPK